MRVSEQENCQNNENKLKQKLEYMGKKETKRESIFFLVQYYNQSHNTIFRTANIGDKNEQVTV